MFGSAIDNHGSEPDQADRLSLRGIGKVDVDGVIAAGGVDLGADFRRHDAGASQVEGDGVLSGVAMDIEIEIGTIGNVSAERVGGKSELNVAGRIGGEEERVVVVAEVHLDRSVLVHIIRQPVELDLVVPFLGIDMENGDVG